MRAFCFGTIFGRQSNLESLCVSKDDSGLDSILLRETACPRVSNQDRHILPVQFRLPADSSTHVWVTPSAPFEATVTEASANVQEDAALATLARSSALFAMDHRILMVGFWNNRVRSRNREPYGVDWRGN